MKNWIKLGLLLMLLGFLGMTIFGAISGHAWSSVFITNDEYSLVETSYTTDEFSSIKIDVDDKIISILPSVDDQIHVQYYVHELHQVIVTQDGDQITFKSDIRWYNYFLLGFEWLNSTNVHQFILYIPSGYNVDLNAETTNGNILVEDIATFQSLTCSTENGDVSIDNSSVAGDLNASATNGAVQFDDVTVTGDVIGETVNGNVTVNQLSSSELTLTSVNGSITVSDALSTDTFLSTTNGNITVEAATSFDETYLKMETTNGNYYLDGVKVLTNSFHDNMTIKLHCSTTNGNITVNFPS